MSFCCYANEESEVQAEQVRWYTAAKVYNCCECGHKIEVGEYYQNISQLQDNRWWRYTTCEKCADLRDSLSETSCVYLEGLADAFTDWLTHGPHTVMKVKEGSHAARLAPSYFLEED